MPEIFYDVENAYEYRVLVNKYCEDSLKLNLKDKSDNFSSLKKDTKKTNHKSDFRKGKESFRDDKKRSFQTKEDSNKNLKSKHIKDENQSKNKPNIVKKHKLKKKEDYA